LAQGSYQQLWLRVSAQISTKRMMPQMRVVIVALFALPSFSAMQAHPRSKAQKAQKEKASAVMSGDASINLHTPAAAGAEQVQVEVHAKGGAALHVASCPNYKCAACETCVNHEVNTGNLRQGLHDFCETSRKCETGMGDWCRSQIVNRVMFCKWQGTELGTSMVKDCVTRMMCNAEGAEMPCETWKQANCNQQAEGETEGGKKVCKGTTLYSPHYDSWCDSNCNSNPPNCPSSMCTCSTSLVQAPRNTTQNDVALMARRGDNKMTEDNVLDGALTGKCGA